MDSDDKKRMDRISNLVSGIRNIVEADIGENLALEVLLHELDKEIETARRTWEPRPQKVG